ncbi:MAG: DUF547 domain-containing protein, partial [Aquificae bacterium]|nr:DUF547 domain-containing protein [Aquificota bacterium]
MAIEEYIKKAKSVLDKNWTGAYTVPSVHLYPHQWNWDSGFIAIGYSHYDTQRAIQELTHLFKAQWKNGMVPQIVFNEKALGKYFPEPDFWKAHESPYAPDGILTSGITMPPIHGYAVLKIYENAKDKKEVIPFLKWIFPKIKKLHRYLYLERNPKDNGLIYIRHPWESGMDNSPLWDKILDRIDINKVKIPSFKRKDNKIIDPEQRPRDIDYKRYIYLVDIFRKNQYDEKKIFKECPFIAADPLFNSILCASNEALIKIADILKEDYKEIEEWNSFTSRAVRDELYLAQDKIFYGYDFIEDKLLKEPTAAGFLPLFGGIPTKKQAKELLEYMNSASFCHIHEEDCFAIPNYDKQRKDFSRKNYWRGPVWININWMIYQGLKRYGFKQKAEHLEKTILELPMRFDFYEYFDSYEGTGYGTKDFSWTASLFIDLAYEYQKQKEIKKILPVFVKDKIINTKRKKSRFQNEELIYYRFNKTVKKIFSRYVSDGLVSYKEILVSPEYKIYKSISSDLENFYPEKLPEKEKIAFYINLYNMMVIDFILERDIKKTVLEIENFFTNLKYKVGDRVFSLYDLEFKIFKERDNSLKKKIPFALVRGTKTSPHL